MENGGFEALVVSLIVIGLFWTRIRARWILGSWARENGYRIVSSRRCWFWRGPFFLRSSERQEVFRVTVADGSGKTRRGWVRCGGFFSGLLRNRADVRWQG